MKKQIGIKVFVIAYLIIMLIPAVFTFLNAGKESVNTENRVLAEFPSIKNEDGLNTAFFLELDDWIKDHIGLRSQMVKANTFINTNIYGNSPEESIILGNNGWLYYSDTVKDYINEPTISDKNAENVAITIKMMQDYVENEGGSFVFTIAPNKNSLYGDNMPYYYTKLNSDGNMELIEKYVTEKGVNYADIRDAFEEKYKENGEVLYQTTDSHWNYKGALLGYETIMNGLGLENTEFADVSFTAKPDWDGDLASMLYSDGAVKDIQLYPDHEFTYDITSHDKAVDALRITTHKEGADNKALIFRDSFFNTLQIYFADSFGDVLFTRAYPYNMTLMEDSNIVIFEIVERNLPNLAKKAPIMKAPMVVLNNEVADFDNSASGIIVVMDENGNVSFPTFSIYAEESNGMMHYYGTVDEDYAGTIYYLNGDKNGDGVVAYKAFPIFEQELLDSEELQDNGFSLYL